ncbi:MAG: porin family protein [Lentimicrobiaceae bacterium]|jgi:outer membrane protein X|nr:porin family protein [Lentimicrobiaceae bacterium]
MKKSLLKKIAITAIAILTMSLPAIAQQKGDMAAGAQLAIGMGDEITNFGIGAKFQYNVTDPIRLEGSFTFFMPKEQVADVKVSFWDLNVNAHYLFPIANQITVYPLAGLGIQGCKVKTSYGGYSASASDSDIAINLGGGIDYALTDQLVLNGELKYKISGDWDRFIISVGVAYRF